MSKHDMLPGTMIVAAVLRPSRELVDFGWFERL